MMQSFDYFIVLAEMRTGSNFLEANINAFEHLFCYGEAFNPHFIGYPKSGDLFGVTQAQREQDPEQLLRVMRDKTQGLPGFRFFHDHDPRIAELALNDRRCAKIILTRNIVESFVSWKIAAQTGQWKLTNAKNLRSAKVHFDALEFQTYDGKVQNFQSEIRKTLQVTGQTGFFIDYEDLGDVQVMNGLAEFLGQSDRLEALNTDLVKQNPAALVDKVTNPQDMERCLAGIDRFGLARVPSFDPARGAAVPSYIASTSQPLMFMPIKSGPTDQITQWLADLDGGEQEALLDGFNQKKLRQWKRQNPSNRSFTVVRHPLLRAHEAFCNHILPSATGSFTAIRGTLRKTYKLPLPGKKIGSDYDLAKHRAAFLGFLKFLKLNLSGQTSIRIDANWASQQFLIQAMTPVQIPDVVIREEDLALGLAFLTQAAGTEAPELPQPADTAPFTLAQIYDDVLEAAAKDAYQRDYMAFGFGPWKR